MSGNYEHNTEHLDNSRDLLTSCLYSKLSIAKWALLHTHDIVKLLERSLVVLLVWVSTVPALKDALSLPS